MTINKGVTYGLRICAYLLMVLGIYAFFTPIVDLLGEIPIVGWWMKSTASSMIFLAAVIICVPIFLGLFHCLGCIQTENWRCYCRGCDCICGFACFVGLGLYSDLYILYFIFCEGIFINKDKLYVMNIWLYL